MARKTKAEAEKTRLALIRTALQLFSEKGVAKTTLNDIASAAGVTKGAFYWHFKNKLEIFEAMNVLFAEEIDKEGERLLFASDKPLEDILNSISYFFKQVEESKELQELFMVSFFKCEYTEEFAPLIRFDQQEINRAAENVQSRLAQLPESCWHNQKNGDTELISQVLLQALIGLLHTWLADPVGSLAERAISTSKLILVGGGVNIPESLLKSSIVLNAE